MKSYKDYIFENNKTMLYVQKEDVEKYINDKLKEFNLQDKYNVEIKLFWIMGIKNRHVLIFFEHKDKKELCFQIQTNVVDKYSIWNYYHLTHILSKEDMEQMAKFDELKDAIDYVITLLVTNDFEIFEGKIGSWKITDDSIDESEYKTIFDLIKNQFTLHWIHYIRANYKINKGNLDILLLINRDKNKTTQDRVRDAVKDIKNKINKKYNIDCKTEVYRKNDDFLVRILIKKVEGYAGIIKLVDDFDLFESVSYTLSSEHKQFLKNNLLKIVNQHYKIDDCFYNVDIEITKYGSINLTFQVKYNIYINNNSFNMRMQNIMKEIYELYKGIIKRVHYYKNDHPKYFTLTLDGVDYEKLIPELTLRKDFDIFDEDL